MYCDIFYKELNILIHRTAPNKASAASLPSGRSASAPKYEDGAPAHFTAHYHSMKIIVEKFISFS
jgi:hypothetical protein